MPSATKIKQDSVQTLTITLASLATSAVGAGQQGNMLTNSNDRPAALLFLKITSGATGPTAGAAYLVYLLRRDDAASPSYADDNAGASDAAITIENSPLLGRIVVTNSTNKAFYGTFDTALLGPLGSSWSIAVVNNSGQALNATGGNHVVKYRYYYPEAQ